jgi:adenylate kinase
VLGGNPSNIVLVVGGPGSGKGVLCARLAKECGCVHMSSGKLLRDEVARGTPLGRQVADSISRGELVSSSVITALIRRNMRKFPGRRVLLDGFPRSLENAIDFSHQMGKPELALHLVCDDTVMMERILKRSRENPGRTDDNIDTALNRLRTYHRSHGLTLEWLRDDHVPVINLDCSGSEESVWGQLLAIGRLMRPAVSFSKNPILAALEQSTVDSREKKAE